MTYTLATRADTCLQVIKQIDQMVVPKTSELPQPKVERINGLIAQSSYKLTSLPALIQARDISRDYLLTLESKVDLNRHVPFGSLVVKFDIARLLGMQSLLSTHWSIADLIGGLAASILAPNEIARNEKLSSPLMTYFFKDNDKKDAKNVSGIIFDLKKEFWWPTSTMYALRNHFIHDGAVNVTPFFFGSGCS